jgi:hypothetical protein
MPFDDGRRESILVRNCTFRTLDEKFVTQPERKTLERSSAISDKGETSPVERTSAPCRTTSRREINGRAKVANLDQYNDASADSAEKRFPRASPTKSPRWLREATDAFVQRARTCTIVARLVRATRPCLRTGITPHQRTRLEFSRGKRHGGVTHTAHAHGPLAPLSAHSK